MSSCFCFLSMFLVAVNGLQRLERKRYDPKELAGISCVNVKETQGNVRYRQKRAIPSLIIKGRSAANYLLQGTTRLPTKTPSQRRFEKPGNFQTALNDFYSVGPRNVRIVSQGNKISRVSGQVGDRQLFLTKCSRGEHCLPVLEIRNTEVMLHQAPILYDLLGIPCDKIVYMKPL